VVRRASDARLVEQPGRHLPRRVDRRLGLAARLVTDPIGLGLRLGHRVVGGALCQQQRAADRLGLVGSDPHGGLVDLGGRLFGCRELLQARDGGACARFHRGGLLLGVFECPGGAFEERIDLVGVVPLADRLEGCAGHLCGCELAHDQSSYSS
jgi:hypothetical protein